MPAEKINNETEQSGKERQGKMHPIANHLIQLQELGLIRDEQQVTVGRKHLDTLDESIRDMTQKLPQDVRVLYRKLKEKDPIVIAPISQDVCSLCGMRLPISLIQAVRMEKDVHSCPNCARMLYYPESPPRRVSQRTSRVGRRKVGISRFSSHSLMIPALESNDVEGAIGELTQLMEAEGYVTGADKLAEEALRREAILSTAVDSGLAFPHVRGVEGGGLALALGISPKGIKFDERSRRLTRIVFFLAIPTAAAAFYLKLLSGLATTFSDAESREALMAATDAEALWKALCKQTRTTIK
mgnify:CR=1 FL=1